MAYFRLLNIFPISVRNALIARANILEPFKTDVLVNRGIRSSFATVEKVMKMRRKLAGPERQRRRSEWLEWNYQAELYAFSKRLHEEISERTLQTAFTHQSYIVLEEQKRTELGVPVQDVPLELRTNTSFITDGENIMVPYIKSFVRHCFKMLPEEGVSAFCSYLMSEDVLSHVSSNIGSTDLILSADFPVEKKTLAQTLKAIVGAIASDGNEEQAKMFVQDFVCTQLVGKHLQEIWDIPDVKSVLDNLLKRHGKLPYEPRLVFESGRNTLEAVYLVAVYSDKVFLGQGYGETLSIAEDIAIHDSLARLFGLSIHEKELPYGKRARELKLSPEKENLSLKDWYSEQFLALTNATG